MCPCSHFKAPKRGCKTPIQLDRIVGFYFVLRHFLFSENIHLNLASRHVLSTRRSKLPHTLNYCVFLIGQIGHFHNFHLKALGKMPHSCCDLNRLFCTFRRRLKIPVSDVALSQYTNVQNCIMLEFVHFEID